MKNKTPDKINSGSILLAFIAIGAGLIGTYAVRTAFAAPAVEPPPAPAPAKPPPRVTVPLASRDIPAGTEISLDDIALYKLTKQEIEESIEAKTFMTNPTQIIGKVVVKGIERGMTFDTSELLPAGKVPGVSGRLKPGLRAVTVAMTPSNALLGLAGPGQRVDVLFHYGQSNESAANGSDAGKAQPGFQPGHHDFNPPRRRDYYGNTIGSGGGSGLDSIAFQCATSTLIQDAEILAFGNQTTPTELASPIDTEDTVQVTLAVDPRQAEMIRVASGHGQLSLTLRSPSDGQQVHLVDPVTLNEIMSVDHTVHVMEIYRGKERSQVVFGSNQSIRTRVFEAPGKRDSSVIDVDRNMAMDNRSPRGETP